MGNKQSQPNAEQKIEAIKVPQPAPLKQVPVAAQSNTEANL